MEGSGLGSRTTQEVGKDRRLGNLITPESVRKLQTALMIVLEPIFEADLPPEQYGYRSERGAHDAVRAIHRLLNTGHYEVIDADLSGYFDNIPHAELMKSVARRIVDRHMLHLIKQWLIAPVEEDDGRGGRKRTTINRDSGCGTPPEFTRVTAAVESVHAAIYIGMETSWV